jgi:hypothetical protein
MATETQDLRTFCPSLRPQKERPSPTPDRSKRNPRKTAQKCRVAEKEAKRPKKADAQIRNMLKQNKQQPAAPTKSHAKQKKKQQKEKKTTQHKPDSLR